MQQFTNNIFIALIWAFLHTSYSLVDFLFGYLVGILLLLFFKARTGRIREFYLFKVWKILHLTLVFFKQLVISNFDVLYHTLQPKLKIKPGIIQFPLEVESSEGIALLANIISLTPGTLSMEVSEDKKTLFVHVLNIDDADTIRKRIKSNFEGKIREVLK